MKTDLKHTPVLLKEVLTALNPKPNHWYLDATLGNGGHSLALLQTKARVLAFDQDDEAIALAKENIQAACPGIKLALFANQDRRIGDQAVNLDNLDCLLVNQNFASLSNVLTTLGNLPLQGALFDLGVSSTQLLSPSRGFSILKDAPLDMRMDKRLGVTAADLINALPEKQLAKLFSDFGDEPQAQRIARTIVNTRARQPIATTSQLAQLVSQIKPHTRLHPATQVFQALRIAVNLELDSLEAVLPQVVACLHSGATLAIISFHSGEDRLVKHFFKNCSDLKVLAAKPIQPSTEEIKLNPRSRSAKLRLAQKI